LHDDPRGQVAKKRFLEKKVITQIMHETGFVPSFIHKICKMVDKKESIEKKRGPKAPRLANYCDGIYFLFYSILYCILSILQFTIGTHEDSSDDNEFLCS
jgi:hypothetical protein